jgi:hypothetical protein
MASVQRCNKCLKASGIEPPTYQEYVDIHVQAMTTPAGHMWGAHGGSNFLPWHREYLIRFENRLRLFNPLVTIPYWDWANDLLPVELDDPQDLANWGISRNSTIGPMPTQTQVNNVMAQTTWNDFRTSLEGIHNSVHVSVGGHMGTASSPSDPIFWLHHGFIDKIWTDWQKLHPTIKPTNLSEQLQPPPIFQRTVGQVMSTQYGIHISVNLSLYLANLIAWLPQRSTVDVMKLFVGTFAIQRDKS